MTVIHIKNLYSLRIFAFFFKHLLVNALQKHRFYLIKAWFLPHKPIPFAKRTQSVSLTTLISTK